MPVIETEPSSSPTEVTVTTQPGEQVPTLGYPTGGGDFFTRINTDGSISSTMIISGGASGGTVSSTTSTGSTYVGPVISVPVVPVDPVTPPYPPSIYSNEYKDWYDTYFNTLEIPEESEPWYIDGYLKDQNGNPLAGIIIARNRATDELYDSVRPDEVTGFYKLDVPTLVEMYLYVILDSGQAVIIDHYTCTKDVSWDLDYLTLYGNDDRFIYPFNSNEYWSSFQLSTSGHKLFGASVKSSDKGFVRIVEWNLPENNEIRGMVYSQSYILSLPTNGGTTIGASICFTSDGTKMYMHHPGSGKIHKYTLPAWNITGLVFNSSTTTNSNPWNYLIGGTRMIQVDPNQEWVFINHGTGGRDYQMSSPGNLSTLTGIATAGPSYTGILRWHDNGYTATCWVNGGYLGYDDLTIPYRLSSQIGGIDRLGNYLFSNDGGNAFASYDGSIVFAEQWEEPGIYSDHPWAQDNRFMRADMYEPEWPQTLRPGHKHIGYNFAMSEDVSDTYPTVSLFSPDGKKVSFLDGYYRAHYWELGTPWNIGTAIHKATIDEAQNPWRDFQISGKGIPFYQIFDICANPDGKTIYIIENYQSVREIYLSRPFDFTSIVRGIFGQTDPDFDAEWNCNNRVIWMEADEWYDGTPESTIQAPPHHSGSFYGVSHQGACFHPSGLWVYFLDYMNGYVWQVPLFEPFKIHHSCMTEKFAAGPILTSPWNENFEGDWDVGSLQISNDGTKMFSQIRDNPYRDPVERGNFSYHVLDTPFDIRTLRTQKQIIVPTLNARWNPDTCQYHADGLSVYANEYYVGMVQSDVVNKYG